MTTQPMIDRNAPVLDPLTPLLDSGEGLMPPRPSPAPEPAPEPKSGPALFVAFVGTNHKGKQQHGRMFLEGIYDLRSISQVANAEGLINQAKGLTTVEILNWRALDI